MCTASKKTGGTQYFVDSTPLALESFLYYKITLALSTLSSNSQHKNTHTHTHTYKSLKMAWSSPRWKWVAVCTFVMAHTVAAQVEDGITSFFLFYKLQLFLLFFLIIICKRLVCVYGSYSFILYCHGCGLISWMFFL